MKKFAILVFLMSILGTLSSCQTILDEEENRIHEQMINVDARIALFQQSPSSDNVETVLQAINDLEIRVSKEELKSSKELRQYNELIKSITEKHDYALNCLNASISQIAIPVVSTQDYLINVGATTTAMRLKKGDLLKFQFNGERPVDLTIYNIDSKCPIKHLSNKIAFQDSLLIQNSAVYLLEIVNKQKPQYISHQIDLYRENIESYMSSYTVSEEVVSADKQDFMAFPKNEFGLTNLFEEPRKVTLRGSWKAAWSGHKRTILALNIPENTVDIAYQLRINTSEMDSYEDGRFHNKLSTRCSKTEILGVTFREKQESHSSILREILQKMETPQREEEAYCSMYVFYNAKDAQNFVSKNGGEVKNYDIDYSLIGTQSCNGRFPVKKQKNVYLGFENDQFSGSVYLWIEAVATSTETNYYRTIYK